MKKFYLLLILALPMRVFAQPIIHNCDNYTVGTVLTNVNCNTAGVDPGSGGANQTWDLSSLTTAPPGADTLKQYFLPNPSGSPYPSANIIDSESTGSYLYMNTDAGQSSVLAVYDVSSGTTTVYPVPQSFSQRPITYNDSFNSTFTRTTSSLGITGAGTVDMVADGYGTLILPDGTDSNVLRVVHYVSETDSVSGVGITTPSTNYFWYDDKHSGPLCTILTANPAGTGPIIGSVTYLTNETPTLSVKGVAGHNLLAFNGNLTNNQLTIQGGFEQGHIYEFAVYNLTGQKIYNTEFVGTSAMLHFDINNQLSSGVYLVNAIEKNNVNNEGMIKLVKQ